MIPLPFSFKFLIAPFIDSYYIKRLGKRKTYVITSLVFMSVMLSYLSVNINDYINNLKILKLIVTNFFVMFLLTFLDVATDAWSLDLVDKEYLGYARSMKLVG